MRVLSVVVATGVMMAGLAWQSPSWAQSVSFGVNVGGPKPAAKNAQPEQAKSTKGSGAPATKSTTQEQSRAWNERHLGSKTVRSLAVVVGKVQEAIDNTQYPCMNVGMGLEQEIKEVFADLPTLEAVRKECGEDKYGPLPACASLRDDAKFQRAFTYLFTCELEDVMKERQRTAKQINQAMTVELGSLPRFQTREKLAASDPWVPRIRERATQLHLDLSALDAKIAETESLEKGIFEKLTPPTLKAADKNPAAEKAANEAVAKAVAQFGCKDCKVVRSVIVGKDYFYERNALGVVTWRGKDTLTLVKTTDAQVCGVVDGRAGQVALGSKFVPNYNAYVPVRFLHLVRCP